MNAKTDNEKISLRVNEMKSKLQESINGKVSEIRGDVNDSKLSVELHEQRLLALEEAVK